MKLFLLTVVILTLSQLIETSPHTCNTGHTNPRICALEDQVDFLTQELAKVWEILNVLNTTPGTYPTYPPTTTYPCSGWWNNGVCYDTPPPPQ